MCDFPSWYQSGKNVWFLTDKEVSKYLREHPDKTMIDAVGHQAIKVMMPEAEGSKYEDWNDDIPKAFLSAIKAGKCSRMMKDGARILEIKLDRKGLLHSLIGPAMICKEEYRCSGESKKHWFYYHGNNLGGITDTCLPYDVGYVRNRIGTSIKFKSMRATLLKNFDAYVKKLQKQELTKKCAKLKAAE